MNNGRHNFDDLTEGERMNVLRRRFFMEGWVDGALVGGGHRTMPGGMQGCYDEGRAAGCAARIAAEASAEVRYADDPPADEPPAEFLRALRDPNVHPPGEQAAMADVMAAMGLATPESNTTPPSFGWAPGSVQNYTLPPAPPGYVYTGAFQVAVDPEVLREMTTALEVAKVEMKQVQERAKLAEDRAKEAEHWWDENLKENKKLGDDLTETRGVMRKLLRLVYENTSEEAYAVRQEALKVLPPVAK